ncbi:MAG: hypothetical protein QOF51_3257, partial [Chloroflexota bacterium]|nr:hypothetical protein [Chloroflexota bacterium]
MLLYVMHAGYPAGNHLGILYVFNSLHDAEEVSYTAADLDRDLQIGGGSILAQLPADGICQRFITRLAIRGGALDLQIVGGGKCEP